MAMVAFECDYSYRAGTARHEKLHCRESYGISKKGWGLRRVLFRGFEHVPQVDECCLTCVIFIYVCRLPCAREDCDVWCT
jgi:hypothetical protein